MCFFFIRFFDLLFKPASVFVIYIYHRLSWNFSILFSLAPFPLSLFSTVRFSRPIFDGNVALYLGISCLCS